MCLIAVLVFHVAPNLFLGFFLGVDIFFVISGYVVTGMLQREMSDCSNTISLMNFYGRRFKRLIPHSIFVLWFILAVGPDASLPPYGIVVKKCVTFRANFLFYSENVDYFGAHSAPNPLLHFWSLAVEEQFYLIFPIAFKLYHLAMAYIRVNNIVRLFMSITPMIFFLLSMALTIKEISVNPSYAFFLPQTRAWQLLLGVILASFHRQKSPVTELLTEDDTVLPLSLSPSTFSTLSDYATKHEVRSSNANDIYSVFDHKLSSIWSSGSQVMAPYWNFFCDFVFTSQLISNASLCIILLCFVFFDSGTLQKSHGFASMLPLICASHLICCTNSESLSIRILRGHNLCYIGDRSYALYLWHYPFIVLAQMYNSSDSCSTTSIFYSTVGLFASVPVALFLYAYFETPIRVLSVKPIICLFSAVVLTAITYFLAEYVVSWRLHQFNRSIERNPMLPDFMQDTTFFLQKEVKLPAGVDLDLTFHDVLAYLPFHEYPQNDVFVLGSTINSSRELILLGDSTAYTFIPVFEALVNKWNISARVLYKFNCPFLHTNVVQWHEGIEDCVLSEKKLLSLLLAESLDLSGKVIILVTALGRYPDRNPPARFSAMNILLKRGVKIINLESFVFPTCYATVQLCLKVNKNNIENCYINRSVTKGSQWEHLCHIQKHFPLNYHCLPTRQLFCTSRICSPIAAGNILTMVDTVHVNPKYYLSRVSTLESLLLPIIFPRKYQHTP